MYEVISKHEVIPKRSSILRPNKNTDNGYAYAWPRLNSGRKKCIVLKYYAQNQENSSCLTILYNVVGNHRAQGTNRQL